MRSVLATAVLGGLVLMPSIALAQAEAFVGKWALRGKQGDAQTGVNLHIERVPRGLRFTRTATFVHREKITWRAQTVDTDGVVHIVYSVRAADGLVGNLEGTTAAPWNRFHAKYRVKNGRIQEKVINRTREGSESWWRKIKTKGARTATLEQVRKFLDAQAAKRPLNRLGALWHILRLSRWQLGKTDSAIEHTKFNPKGPYDPDGKHTLLLPLDHYTAEMLYDRLERQFAWMMTTTNTRWSFEAALYHYVATASLDTIEFKDPAAEAARVRQRWGDKLFVDSTDWGVLRKKYEHMRGNACVTVCLADMEDVIARGVLAALSHKDLVKAVQDRLPSLFGCVSKSFTGSLRHNYDMRGYVKYGRGAFLGRPLYYRAMDKRKLDNPSYQGENLVLTAITDEAVKDFGRMGGFGTVDNLPNFPPAGKTIDDEIRKLSGVSRIIARYWELRVAGKETEAEALIKRPFFDQTSTSVDGSLGDWVRKLYEYNPRTPYKLFAYDYGFTDWYYDRVVKAASGMKSWRD